MTSVPVSRPSKMRVAFHLLLPAVGVCCLVASHTVLGVLPYLLGAVMVLVGALDIATDLRAPEPDPGRITPGSDVILVLLGIALLATGSASLNLIGVMWGFMGLGKAAREIDELFGAWRAKEFSLPALVLTVFELALGMMLVISPLANIEHHILLLGVELICYPITVRRGEKGVSVRV